MITVEATIKGFDRLLRNIDRGEEKVEMSWQAALRAEAYQLRGVMRKEIRVGAPGGRRFQPLTFLSRGLGIRTSRRFRKDRPLIGLANAVTYDVQKHGGFEVRVGFTRRTFPHFRHRAKQHQAGFVREITRAQRRFIINQGARRGTIEGGNTPFFLRRNTKRFVTPARPIVDPFWKAHRDEAMRNIRQNFVRKMRGERI